MFINAGYILFPQGKNLQKGVCVLSLCVCVNLIRIIQ